MIDWIKGAPMWLWTFLLVGISIFAIIVSVSNRSTGQLENKMRFTWNQEKRTLESSDPKISVRVFGSAYGQGFSEYVLTLGERHIGFSTITPTEKTKDGHRIWVVDAIGIWVKRGGRDGTVYANETKFVNKAEQDQVISIIKDALSQFDSITQGDAVVNSVVQFSQRLQKLLSSGELIQRTQA